MKIDRISYSESVHFVNDYGKEKWIKSSMHITDIEGSEEIHRASILSIQYVTETINHQIEKYKLESYQVKERIIEQTPVFESAVEKYEYEILNVKSLSELESYKLLSSNYPQLKEAYNKKLTELSLQNK